MNRKLNKDILFKYLSGRLVLLICLMIFFSGHISFGQDNFRIKADFTVKIKQSDGSMNLTKGKVYYDKYIKKLIYLVSFPQTEKWVVVDTSLYKIRDDRVIDRTTIPSINEFSVFHLSLNSGLKDFGLKKAMFKVAKVEKKNDQVLSYWRIPRQADSPINHVVMAKKNNRLESVVMVGDGSVILSRQFFRKYVNIGALEFPQQIVQIHYDKDGNENYQVTEFSNVEVNDPDNAELYNHRF